MGEKAQEDMVEPGDLSEGSVYVNNKLDQAASFLFNEARKKLGTKDFNILVSAIKEKVDNTDFNEFMTDYSSNKESFKELKQILHAHNQIISKLQESENGLNQQQLNLLLSTIDKKVNTSEYITAINSLIKEINPISELTNTLHQAAIAIERIQETIIFLGNKLDADFNQIKSTSIDDLDEDYEETLKNKL